MRFFFSGEVDTASADAYREMRGEMEATLNRALGENNYGDAIEKIAIIPVIVGPEFYGSRRERRLIKHRGKVADYRLFIDWEAFVGGSAPERKRLLLENVLVCRGHQSQAKRSI